MPATQTLALLIGGVTPTSRSQSKSKGSEVQGPAGQITTSGAFFCPRKGGEPCQTNLSV